MKLVNAQGDHAHPFALTPPELGDHHRDGGRLTHLDPLDEDEDADPFLSISHRQLLRLVFIAAETGARFQREAIAVDPIAWLLAPRDLFAGRTAIDACRDKSAFMRAIVLHGLSLGVDACPEDLDCLLERAPAVPCGTAIELVA